MKDPKLIITVSGEDKVGIVARFANVLADYSVNIEDIKQTIMQDHFVMFVMGDLSKSTYTFQEVKDELLKTGEDLQMEVWVQRKAIFDKMHNI
jgi:ACT domain-containing protein